MSALNSPPLDYNAGLDFNYSLWTPGTNVSLVNVPWDNNYRDIVKFDTPAALNSYINSIENSGIRIKDMSYVKPGQPIRIDLPFNVANRYNYLRASNPAQPIPGDFARDYYYFVTDVRYIAPQTTEVVLQLDVWQTFGHTFKFGNSFIERGHISIANFNGFDNYGRDFLTIPEGLDIGGEYQQIARKKDVVMTNEDFDILIVSTVQLTGDYGTEANPTIRSAQGGSMQGMPSGAEMYILDSPKDLGDLLWYLSDYPWISAGIISITAIPPVERYGYEKLTVQIGGVNVSNIGINGSKVGRGKYTDMFDNWRNSEDILSQIPERYRHLRKLFTYPYMVIEMTTWGATPVILKPESWADPNAKITEKAALAPPNQKVVIYPNRYNAKKDSVIDSATVGNPAVGTSIEYYDDGGDYLDVATLINNFPSFAAVNNGALAYLANNARGIAFSRNSADWSQQKALGANQTSYDQQSAGIEMSKNINQLERTGMAATVGNNQLALTQSVAANGIAGVVGSSIGMGLGGATGGMGGAAGAGGGVLGAVQSQVMGGINAGISIDQQSRNLGVSQNLSSGANAAQNNQASYVRDTNKSLSDWAARGDYSNSIAGINAKVQDAQMIQPTTSGQMGGEAFNLIHGATEVSLRWKMLNGSALRAVCEYWLRYGYAVQQFAVVPESLQVMSHFTFWKLAETYVISSAMPESVKQVIRGIFEKGVTVWRTPTDIGAIDLAVNQPIPGVTLNV